MNPNPIRKAFAFGYMLAALAASSLAVAADDVYRQRNLVSDGTVAAENTDANLVNAWGVAFNPFGPVWVADNGTGVSTLYDGDGKKQPSAQPLVVQIPPPASGSGQGTPTGIVFNASTGFVVSQGGASGPSRFLFATEDGVIAGWAPNVNATRAIVAVDNSTRIGAVYKGLALSAGGNGSLLYAADFRNNRIDVFDSTFKPVTQTAGAFTDPTLPAGFAPFGLQAISGDIYVSYARQDADKHDDVSGAGLGYINVFDPNGKLLRRFASQGTLNSPWGMALAPAGFGKFANSLLVGNFGDGRINAYELASGNFLGQLQGSDQQPLQINGLWGIAFGNGFQNQPVDTLFFAAGPNDEEHGLYGRIDVDTSQ
ncbi:TIGR03118 family protein [Noviherbaspirillum massiliense]|uniref:TIGR03118 family protein n=1 Tax=Noviherbaspirillum massiliense TaxID=1465823 RepID=UPI00030EACF2|nr:TIGR03118 family protein [Noviherbaspirillum massiliense]